LRYWPDRVRPYRRGNILYWQGDPVESLFMIHQGAVKISSLSGTGKIYSHGILGLGHILGASDYFLDGIHETTAEVTDKSTLVQIPIAQFQERVASDPHFSSIVMRELARETKVHFTKAQDLSFLDAQQRLMHSLIKLADEHGLKTDRGIEINVSVTHEDFAEIINANRTTITLCLQELKKLGYLRIEGRRIILIPVAHITILDQLCTAVVSGGVGEAADLSTEAIEEGIDPVKVLNALMSGMKEVDRKYALGEIDVNEVMWSSIQMKEALPIVETAVERQNIPLSFLGRILFGTVQGDIHDIGKTIVSMLFKARGFEVIELGVNVSTEQFAAAVQEYRPDILAMSALLTTTQNEMLKVIQALQCRGLRDQVKVLIGGVPTTPKFAQDIGADGYAQDARGGVELAWGWCIGAKG
jgi:5-methyltetrahydrofolate--homocysteine methyltransferase